MVPVGAKPRKPLHAGLFVLRLCGIAALAAVLWAGQARAKSGPPTTGLAYAVSNAAMHGKLPSPEQEDVVVPEGHRLEAGRFFVVVVSDSHETTGTRYLTWLTIEFRDEGVSVVYTLPNKDIRVYYSAFGLGTRQEELYSEAIKGTVTVDEEHTLLSVDLVVSLVSATEPVQHAQWHVEGQYVYRGVALSELRWPWGSR